MEVQINRLDQTIPLPAYQTAGSSAFDICAREDTTIKAKEINLIPSGLIIATPPGYALIISARSSLAKKKGLMLSNGIGVIDNDYCGPEDEIKISVYNFTDQDVTVQKGERIAQGLFLKNEKCQWVEKPIDTDKSRGGFGSTDRV